MHLLQLMSSLVAVAFVASRTACASWTIVFRCDRRPLRCVSARRPISSRRSVPAPVNTSVSEYVTHLPVSFRLEQTDIDLCRIARVSGTISLRRNLKKGYVTPGRSSIECERFECDEWSCMCVMGRSVECPSGISRDAAIGESAHRLLHQRRGVVGDVDQSGRCCRPSDIVLAGMGGPHPHGKLQFEA